MTVALHAAPLAEMDPVTLYRVLQLRTDVFVVEQNCPYPELDGRDLEPDALMVWASAEGGDGANNAGDERVVATLRLLHDGAAHDSATHDHAPHADAPPEEALRIGRVTAHPDHRGDGLAARLFERGLEECARLAPHLPIVLDAQEPLEWWYARFGFERVGDTFLEDDIPHVPMRRKAGALGA